MLMVMVVRVSSKDAGLSDLVPFEQDFIHRDKFYSRPAMSGNLRKLGKIQEKWNV